MKVALLISLFTKCQQKTVRYFRVAFQGFSGSKGLLLYSNLSSFRYQLFSSFLNSFFFTFQSFSVYVTCFVYLYLQMLVSYPFDFRSLQQSIISVFESGHRSLFLNAFNTCNLPLSQILTGIYIICPYNCGLALKPGTRL